MVAGVSFLHYDKVSTSIKPTFTPVPPPCLLPGRVGSMVPLPSSPRPGRGVVTNNFYSSGVKVTYNQGTAVADRNMLSDGRSVRHGICAAHARGRDLKRTAEPCRAASPPMRQGGFRPFLRRGGISSGVGVAVAGGGGDSAALSTPGHAAAARERSSGESRRCARRNLAPTLLDSAVVGAHRCVLPGGGGRAGDVSQQEPSGGAAFPIPER